MPTRLKVRLPIAMPSWSYVAARSELTLDELLQSTKDITTPDEIYAMIAADILHVDWRAAPFAEPTKVRVFAASRSAKTIKDGGRPASVSFSPNGLQCGTQINWDGRLWSVVNVGDTSVSLLSEDQNLAEIPITAFQSLVSENRLAMVSADAGSGSDSAIRDRLSRASEIDLKAATHRADLIRRYLDSGVLPAKMEVPERTLFRWLEQYRKAEAAYGNGFLGLLPRSSQRGNRAAKLPKPLVG